MTSAGSERPPRSSSASLLAAPLLATLVIYGGTLGFGFFWDDYEVLRPWPAADVTAAFTGPYRPWDASAAFYRPLTSLYYAAISHAFGWNAALLHLIPVVAVAALAALTTRFVAQETGQRAPAVIAGVLVAAHPTLATSLGPWIANQYHTLMLIAFMAALFVWQRGRMGRSRWWWTALPWLIAAAWFKEGGIMLGVALLAAHAARARWSGDLPAPPRAAVLTLATAALGLIAWRALWLDTSFGYGFRSWDVMAANLLRGPRYVLMWPVGTPLIAWLATGAKLIALGAIAWLFAAGRRTPGARIAFIGATVFVCANLPLVFVSSVGRWHLVGWGAVLMISGALGEWIARAPRAGRLAAPAILAVLALSSLDRIRAFDQCSPEALLHALDMAELPQVPVELRTWLTALPAACAAGPVTPFDAPMSSLTWTPR
jgi:hypothetical protein